MSIKFLSQCVMIGMMALMADSYLNKLRRKDHNQHNNDKFHYHHSENPNNANQNKSRALKAHHEFESRIVGGDNAAAGEFKFMVSWDGDNCGGSLIHDQLVLTAAHCDGVNGGVRIGSHKLYRGGVTRGVQKQVAHPNYNAGNFDNDFMILKLSKPVDISQYPPIELNNIASKPSTNELLTVIGFGDTSEKGGSGSNRLQKVQVPIQSHQLCKRQWPEIKRTIHFCAAFTKGGKDSCWGDSGGPILEDRNGMPVQVGVVSFGEGCARPYSSSVYARVSGAYDWIQSQICELATVNRPASCGSPPPPTASPSVTSPASYYYDDSQGGYYDDGTQGGYYNDGSQGGYYYDFWW